MEDAKATITNDEVITNVREMIEEVVTSREMQNQLMEQEEQITSLCLLTHRLVKRVSDLQGKVTELADSTLEGFTAVRDVLAGDEK